MKLIAGVCAAMAISTVGLIGTTHAESTIDEQARAEEITAVGCVRAWKPAAADVTKMPENREPGMAGMFLFTPLASSSVPGFELPTYLLTPSATANFQQHLDRKVEVVGVPQIAPPPTTVRVIVVTSSQQPENRPDVESFPRLTVRSMRRVSDSCPS
jgi:hypothetical protein